MQRAEIVEYNKPLVIKGYPIPDAPPKGLVVKTSYAGVCHSDIHLWEDDFKLGDGKSIRFRDILGEAHLPLVMGHEISGVIHSIGSDEEQGADPSLKVGDRVVLYPWLGCGACGICDSPRPQNCPSSAETLGVVKPGGFSNYVSITTRRHVIKVPDNVPLDVACMFPCSALTTYNAVSAAKEFLEERAAALQKSTLLIIGAGGLGLWCLQMAKAVLPKHVRVLSADVSDDKLEGARKRGADATVLWPMDISEPDAAKVALEAAEAPSIDAVIDFVGSGVTVGRAVNVVSKAGIVVPVGLFGGKLEVGVPALIFKTLTISAKYVGGVNQLKSVIKLASEGKIESPPLTHYKLSEITDVLENLRKGKIFGRAIIKYD